MRKAVAVCGFCLFALPVPAAAEWHFTPMIGITFAGKTTLQDFENATGEVHPNIGGGVTFLTSGVIGVEGIAVMTPGFFQAGRLDLVESSRATAVMGNVMLTVPQKWTEYSLRPFVSGGLGLLRTSQTDRTGQISITSNVTGFNIGGGAVGYFSKRTGIRFDVRYYSNLHGVDQRASDDGAVSLGDVHLRYMTASVGIVLRR